MGYLVPALLAFFAVIRIWDFAREGLLWQLVFGLGLLLCSFASFQEVRAKRADRPASARSPARVLGYAGFGLVLGSVALRFGP